MRKKKFLALFTILVILCGYVAVNEAGIHGAKGEGIGGNEDLEIIENLDFLDNLVLFEEDLALLENYDGIDQTELMGDDDEKTE